VIFGFGPQLFEQLRASRDFASFDTMLSVIGKVAEDQRIRGAGLNTCLAGSLHPSMDAAPFPPHFSGVDALNAERAFLHHAAFTHGNIRIQLEVQRLVPRRAGKKLKKRTLYPQAFRAIARADTSIVDLRV
jgi:hypothetical protein